MSDKPDEEEYFVIVCTDFHVAVGLYEGSATAIKAARAHTEASAEGCVFLPVPFEVYGKGRIELLRGKPMTDTDDRRKGYL
jgi:hypothetical protein